MKCAEQNEVQVLPVKRENVIRMPSGLLGFEQIKEYVLLSNPEEAPFLWLQVLGDPGLAFLVISPFVIRPDYRPDVPDEDARTLELQSPQDALVLNIVTLRNGGQATVNLKGPIIVNQRTLVAKQVIPSNAAEYDLRQPLATS